MDFSQAFRAIRDDENLGMRLPFWKDPTNVIRVQNPDAFSKMTHPYLYAESAKGRVPWKETVPELFSNDWEIITIK